MKFSNHKNEIERQIIVELVADLLKAGYAIKVNDGEEDCTVYLEREEEIFAAMSTTDDEYLFVRRGKAPKSAGFEGWVRLIYGNDADVISDFTGNLERVIRDGNGWAVAERFGR